MQENPRSEKIICSSFVPGQLINDSISGSTKSPLVTSTPKGSCKGYPKGCNRLCQERKHSSKNAPTPKIYENGSKHSKGQDLKRSASTKLLHREQSVVPKSNSSEQGSYMNLEGRRVPSQRDVGVQCSIAYKDVTNEVYNAEDGYNEKMDCFSIISLLGKQSNIKGCRNMEVKHPENSGNVPTTELTIARVLESYEPRQNAPSCKKCSSIDRRYDNHGQSSNGRLKFKVEEHLPLGNVINLQKPHNISEDAIKCFAREVNILIRNERQADSNCEETGNESSEGPMALLAHNCFAPFKINENRQQLWICSVKLLLVNLISPFKISRR